MLSYAVNWVLKQDEHNSTFNTLRIGSATVSEVGTAVAKMPFHEWRDHLSLQLGHSGLCLWSGSFNLISGLTLFWQTSNIQYSINLEIYTVYTSNHERCLFESEPACTCFRVDDVDFAHTCLAESLTET